MRLFLLMWLLLMLLVLLLPPPLPLVLSLPPMLVLLLLLLILVIMMLSLLLLLLPLAVLRALGHDGDQAAVLDAVRPRAVASRVQYQLRRIHCASALGVPPQQALRTLGVI